MENGVSGPRTGMEFLKIKKLDIDIQVPGSKIKKMALESKRPLLLYMRVTTWVTKNKDSGSWPKMASVMR